MIGDDGGFLQAVSNAYSAVNFDILYQFEVKRELSEIFTS